ncbi:YppF family protein [Virgibacillus sp. 179-BFC.A HS]|uniref:YppF family protein n=1 Tax=Tigheibacillus jepli TaxID=3035914 RepID=A0ABU5CJU7_9BACI|nr:YppF family protein [Virgibacillus sp. 179-BFC.A HS]MDY0406196.1 YppF family protein [Virgibacillus sp. 179-BFC.A HS]
MDALLDFYQSKYIAQQIDILEYKSIFGYLSGRGAVSAHDYAQLMK